LLSSHKIYDIFWQNINIVTQFKLNNAIVFIKNVFCYFCYFCVYKQCYLLII